MENRSSFQNTSLSLGVSYLSLPRLQFIPLVNLRSNLRAPYKFGIDTPGWNGAPWAPTSMTYVPRSVWVVNQIPKDPYYNWGLHINYVDKETNVIFYKEVYEKSGDFRTWVTLFVNYGECLSGKNNVGDYDVQLMIDEKAHHASSFGRVNDPKRGSGAFYLPVSELGPDFFTLNNMLLLSK